MICDARKEEERARDNAQLIFFMCVCVCVCVCMCVPHPPLLRACIPFYLQLKTADGESYFNNLRTGVTQWDRPTR